MTQREQKEIRERLLAYSAKCRRAASRSNKYKTQISSAARADAYLVAAKLIPTTCKKARV